jgi:hypothetical protein
MIIYYVNQFFIFYISNTFKLNFFKYICALLIFNF